MLKIGKIKNKIINLKNYVKDEPEILNHKDEALIIIMKYGVFGLLWILISDKFLNFFISNMKLYRNIQTYKGWAFVLITMIFVYYLINSRVKRIQHATNKTLEALEELKASNEEQIVIEKELIYQKYFIHRIIDEAPVIIAIWDEENGIKSINPFCEKLFGYTEEELINKKWPDIFITPDNKLAMHNLLEDIMSKDEIIKHESQFLSKTGTPIDILWSSSIIKSIDNESKVIVSIGMDIRDRKKYEENIKYMAFYDSLTGLPNRTMFINEINILINDSEDHHKFAIAYLDFDNFKYINNTLGHYEGDKFLKFIGNKLSSEIKPTDIVSRLGGDEFAILFNSIGSEELLMEKLDKIKNGIGRMWSTSNHQYFISMSIGVAIYPDNGYDVATLLKNSEIAMYAAKKEGKNKVLLYHEYIKESTIWHILMANKIQEALDNGEFTLYYQPQYELNSGSIVGMEALVRWIHPTDGFISPDVFIPITEETGQIYDLERRIIRHALTQKQKLEREGFNHIELSVNLSSKTLIGDSSFKLIEEILSSFDIDYSKIVIEITETAIISDLNLVIKRLNRLKSKGFKIALDDFGTGYSSITYLKILPIDIIKLDKSYINSVPTDCKNTSIVKFILSLAHELDYRVIAEGIETIEQLEYLKEIKCETGQGFYLGKPLPEEKINDVIRNSI